MRDDSDSGETTDAPVTIGALIDEHHESVYRYAFRLTGRQADAEDVAQQTYLIAHEKLHQLKKPSAARSWLLTIARNCFLKRLRIKTATPASAIDVDVEQVEQKTDVEDDRLIAKVNMNAVEAAIQELDDHHRLVIMMFYFEKLAYKQIAEQLDVAVGTVMSRLSRAKIKLREVLSAQYEETGEISN